MKASHTWTDSREIDNMINRLAISASFQEAAAQTLLNKMDSEEIRKAYNKFILNVTN